MEGDKEKYTKALDKARNIYVASKNKDILSTLATIFPEIKESEDERIKTNIIKLLRFVRDTYHQYSDECDEAIAWVEKQGEHANFRNKIQVGDRVTRNEDGALVNLSQLNRVAEPDEKRRKRRQKPTDNVEPNFRVKYAGSEYNVLEVKDSAGITFYGIEDEPNHIDYINAGSCEIIDGYTTKEMRN